VGTPADWKYVESMSEVQARAMTALWVYGADYMEIADKWECTTAAARLAVERTLSDSLDDSEDRSKQRRRMVMQYDALLKEYLPLALSKNRNKVAYARLVLQIGAQKSRLLGMEAAVEINVNMPSDQELMAWTQSVLEMKGMEVPVEGDPFELRENPDTGVYE
jgi:hypothetical protein